jgi:hypothetical protein
MATIADIYNASFGSIDFLEDHKSGFSPSDAPREVEYNVIHIPGGNTNIVQRVGLKVRELTLTIAADTDDMDDLAGAIDTSATLVYSRGSVSARLVALTDRVVAGPTGIENATAKFIL